MMRQQTVCTYPLYLTSWERVPMELWRHSEVPNCKAKVSLSGMDLCQPWAFLSIWSGSCYRIRKAAVLQDAVQRIIDIQIFWLGHNSPRVLSVCKHQHVKSMTQVPVSQREKACYLTLKWIPSYEDVKGEGRRRSLCSKRQTYLTHAIKQGP